MGGRRLGQHFLEDKNILAQIAREALSTNHQKLITSNCVIEIGPGHGELTKALIENGAEHIVAIEKDQKLCEHLVKSKGQWVKGSGQLEVIHSDVRTALPELTKNSKLMTKNFVITGNIPYYLTGYLLRLLGDLVINHKLSVTRIALTVQKEVAERACAEAPHANLLSSTIRGWASPRIAFSVPRGAFAPPPKVNSALLILEPLAWETEKADPRYFAVAKKTFAHPRKTLANNLRAGFSPTAENAERFVKDLGLSPQDRPSALTPSHIKTLVKMVYN